MHFLRLDSLDLGVDFFHGGSENVVVEVGGRGGGGGGRSRHLLVCR